MISELSNIFNGLIFGVIVLTVSAAVITLLAKIFPDDPEIEEENK